MNIPVNLALGLGMETYLKRVVQIADGKVEINQEYKIKGKLVFQIVKIQKIIHLIFI
jgi:hypothetical protein